MIRLRLGGSAALARLNYHPQKRFNKKTTYHTNSGYCRSSASERWQARSNTLYVASGCQSGILGSENRNPANQIKIANLSKQIDFAISGAISRI